MRVLITGMAGFAGNYLVRHLINIHNAEFRIKKRPNYSGMLEILGADNRKGDFSTKLLSESQVSLDILEIDLRERSEVEKMIREFKPDEIYHLAAQSSVSYSWEKPVETFEINVFGGINIFDSVKKYCPGCKILVACTAEEYGSSSGRKAAAIDENCKINPANPYAISKAALDFFAMTYYKMSNLLIYISRSFNHTGPGQSERFVVSDFAKQISEIEKGLREPVIHAGNLNANRDFLDVRDAVSAYKCITEKGIPGEVYNVCSGKKIKISEILEILISLSNFKNIRIEIDQNKIRPIDSDSIYGDNSKIMQQTGWHPEYIIKASLSDVLDWYD